MFEYREVLLLTNDLSRIIRAYPLPSHSQSSGSISSHDRPAPQPPDELASYSVQANSTEARAALADTPGSLT